MGWAAAYSSSTLLWFKTGWNKLLCSCSPAGNCTADVGNSAAETGAAVVLPRWLRLGARGGTSPPLFPMSRASGDVTIAKQGWFELGVN